MGFFDEALTNIGNGLAGISNFFTGKAGSNNNNNSNANTGSNNTNTNSNSNTSSGNKNSNKASTTASTVPANTNSNTGTNDYVNSDNTDTGTTYGDMGYAGDNGYLYFNDIPLAKDRFATTEEETPETAGDVVGAAAPVTTNGTLGAGDEKTKNDLYNSRDWNSDIETYYKAKIPGWSDAKTEADRDLALAQWLSFAGLEKGTDAYERRYKDIATFYGMLAPFFDKRNKQARDYDEMDTAFNFQPWMQDWGKGKDWSNWGEAGDDLYYEYGKDILDAMLGVDLLKNWEIANGQVEGATDEELAQAQNILSGYGLAFNDTDDINKSLNRIANYYIWDKVYNDVLQDVASNDKNFDANGNIIDSYSTVYLPTLERLGISDYADESMLQNIQNALNNGDETAFNDFQQGIMSLMGMNDALGLLYDRSGDEDAYSSNLDDVIDAYISDRYRWTGPTGTDADQDGSADWDTGYLTPIGKDNKVWSSSKGAMVEGTPYSIKDLPRFKNRADAVKYMQSGMTSGNWNTGNMAYIANLLGNVNADEQGNKYGQYGYSGTVGGE